MPTRASIEIGPTFDEHAVNASFAGRHGTRFGTLVEIEARRDDEGWIVAQARPMTTA